MEMLPCIIQKLFKFRDMNQLEEYNMLHILKSYAEALYKYYIAIRFEKIEIGDLHLIEFVCIRVIYLALNMDEMCTHDNLWNMPHTEINRYVPKAWPTKKTVEIEREILAICDWNPIRFCKLLCGDINSGSPLWDSPASPAHENLTETLPKPHSSQINNAVLPIL